MLSTLLVLVLLCKNRSGSVNVSSRLDGSVVEDPGANSDDVISILKTHMVDTEN